MYKVLLLSIDEDITEKISSLELWGEDSGFSIAASTNHLTLIYKDYDLIIAGKEAGLSLLRTVNSDQLPAVILYSSSPDFEAARQGIVLKAYDYITEFSETGVLSEALIRLRNELSGSTISVESAVSHIYELFETRDDSIYTFLHDFSPEFRTRGGKSTGKGKEVFSRLCECLYDKYQWLDLYINDKIFRTASDSEDIPAMIMTLFSEFCELYPRHSAQLDELFDRILLYPDGDLRQKALSAELHINNTYLSTVFLAQTGVRFVDYINIVKLKRAAMLLLDTKLAVTEIAARLDYKDNSYFSKLFREKYGVTPSLFRLPNAYDFQI